MNHFWIPVIFRLALIAALGLTAGVAFNERIGFIVATGGLLVLIALHVIYLKRAVEDWQVVFEKEMAKAA